MTGDSTAGCAVCLAPTTTRCSQCKQLYFCSPDHQNLLWGTHKYLCKIDDVETYYAPPLTRGEADFARQSLRTSKVSGRFSQMYPDLAGKTVIQLVETLGLYSGTFEDLLDGVTAASPDPIQEPFLTAIVIIVRAHILNRYRGGPLYHAQPYAYRCHSMFSLSAIEYVCALSAAQHGFDNDDRDNLGRPSTFRVLNAWFRTLQDHSTLMRLNGEREEAFTNDMLAVSLKRVERVDRRGWHPRFQELALDGIQSNRNLLIMQGTKLD
ncbi:hypothetical protein JCM11491_000417 [Sporobolomyces phaffii]